VLSSCMHASSMHCSLCGLKASKIQKRKEHAHEQRERADEKRERRWRHGTMQTAACEHAHQDDRFKQDHSCKPIMAQLTRRLEGCAGAPSLSVAAVSGATALSSRLLAHRKILQALDAWGISTSSCVSRKPALSATYQYQSSNRVTMGAIPLVHYTSSYGCRPPVLQVPYTVHTRGANPKCWLPRPLWSIRAKAPMHCHAPPAPAAPAAV
jgi:hypothetical protein